MNLAEKLRSFKQQKLYGRYVTNKHIKLILDNLSSLFLITTIGYSVKKYPIYSVQIGTGKTKIFMWSQMHGNESTTTKSLFDLFEFLESDHVEAIYIKNNYTLLCIPILNPDGAEAYTRENANEIDLNRDAIDLSQPESNALLNIFNDFKPDFCFNLHDQRTIYGVGDTNKPATVSFLAPAYNEARAVNHVRQKAMNVISIINNELQQYIPNQVGRFDDTYNGNCVGDTFQSLGVPTILFESGHYQEDYQREETRKYIFIALVCGIVNCSENEIVIDNKSDYLNIPQNKMSFNDFIYRNIRINANSLNIITNFAAQYTEVLIEDEIIFEAYISEIGDLENCFGHLEYDGLNQTYSDNDENYPKIDVKADFYLNKNIKFVNGLKII